MVAVLEQETMPDAVEATLNYIVDTGEKVFTETAAPGAWICAAAARIRTGSASAMDGPTPTAFGSSRTVFASFATTRR